MLGTRGGSGLLAGGTCSAGIVLCGGTLHCDEVAGQFLGRGSVSD